MANETQYLDVAGLTFYHNTASEKFLDYVDSLNLMPVESTNGVQQIADNVASGFSFVGKNPNAIALDSTLNGTLQYGAIGQFSAAFGGKSSAQGKRSMAVGTTTVAKGNYSFAAGDNTVALGNDSAVFGYQSTAKGQASFAAGSGTQAKGNSSTSFGKDTLAEGDYTISAGMYTVARDQASVALGRGTVAYNGALVVGRYNDYTSEEFADTIFAVGCGTADGSRRTSLRVSSDGYVYIGYSSDGTAESNRVVTRREVELMTSTNISNGPDNYDGKWGTAINQVQDSSYRNGFDFTGKNPNAEAYDSTLSTTLTNGAFGDYAAAFGGKSSARGKRSMAVGTTTVAVGNYSFAAGDNSVAYGPETFAAGYQTTAIGQDAATFGSGTVAKGAASFAIGKDNKTSKDATYSFVAGIGNETLTQASAAIGTFLKNSNMNGQVVVGRYNKTLDDDVVFAVGAGGNEENRRTGLAVDINGRLFRDVGIGKEYYPVSSEVWLANPLDGTVTNGTQIPCRGITNSRITSHSQLLVGQSGAYANTIVQRTDNGNIFTADPTNDQHAATKRYVDASIKKIENRLIDYTEDSSEEYKKTVPTDAAKFAVLNKVGGKSIRSGRQNLYSYTPNDLWFDLYQGSDFMTDASFSLPAGTYSYYFSLDIDGEQHPTSYYVRILGETPSLDENLISVGTITTTSETDVFISVEVGWEEEYSDYHVTGSICLTIVEGDKIPNGYIPYDGPRRLEHSKVTKVVSVGKNRVGSDVLISSSWELYNNGSTPWYQYPLDLEDGWYCATAKIKPSPAQNQGLFLYIQKCENNAWTTNSAVYDISSNKSAGYLITGNGTNNTTIAEKSPCWFKVDSKNNIKYRLVAATVTQRRLDTVEWIQIEKIRNFDKIPSSTYLPGAYGSPTEYKPYHREEYAIPSAIQSLDSYGCGIGNLFNYIDFENKQYVQNVKKVTFDGSENWNINSGWFDRTDTIALTLFELKVSDIFVPSIADTMSGIILSSRYNALRASVDVDAGEPCIDTSNGHIYIMDYNYYDLDGFMMHLRENPLEVVYKLKEPIVTDISHLLSDYEDYKFISVEGNGVITAENENKNPLPWTVTFAEI